MKQGVSLPIVIDEDKEILISKGLLVKENNQYKMTAEAKAFLIPSSLSLTESSIGFQANFFNKRTNPTKRISCQKNNPTEKSPINLSIISNVYCF